MRFFLSITLACVVWLAAAHAMADVEAVCGANSFFTCEGGSIGFSAGDSSTTQGQLYWIWWDWDNDGTYDENGPWEDEVNVSHNFYYGGVWYVKVKVMNDAYEWDTVTGGPFYVADPAIAADPAYGQRPLQVDFSCSDSLPAGLSRSYEWWFDWTPPELPTGNPDSTEDAPSHEYTLPDTYRVLVLVTYGENEDWVCLDSVQIVVY